MHTARVRWPWGSAAFSATPAPCPDLHTTPTQWPSGPHLPGHSHVYTHFDPYVICGAVLGALAPSALALPAAGPGTHRHACLLPVLPPDRPPFCAHSRAHAWVSLTGHPHESCHPRAGARPGLLTCLRLGRAVHAAHTRTLGLLTSMGQIALQFLS